MRAFAVLLLAGLAAGEAHAQAPMSIDIGAGLGLSSGAVRTFDQYRSEFGSDLALDVRLGVSAMPPFRVQLRVGASLPGDLTVMDCSATCRNVRSFGGPVLSAGLGIGLDVAPRLTASLGIGVAKFVGSAPGDDECEVLPAGCFSPSRLARQSSLVGVEVGLRRAVTRQVGLEVLDLVGPARGPGSSGLSHRLRVLVSWRIERPRETPSQTVPLEGAFQAIRR